MKVVKVFLRKDKWYTFILTKKIHLSILIYSVWHSRHFEARSRYFFTNYSDSTTSFINAMFPQDNLCDYSCWRGFIFEKLYSLISTYKIYFGRGNKYIDTYGFRNKIVEPNYHKINFILLNFLIKRNIFI